MKVLYKKEVYTETLWFDYNKKFILIHIILKN